MKKPVKSRDVKPKFDAEEILKRPYTRLIVPDDDGSYRAEILEFPGCIATAETEEEAVRALREVAMSWLASMDASGRAIPDPAHRNDYSGKLVLRLPKSLHRKAAVAAERDGSSLNTFIVTSIAEQMGTRAAGRRSSSAQVISFTTMVVNAVGQEPFRLANSQQFAPIDHWSSGTSMSTKGATRSAMVKYGS